MSMGDFETTLESSARESLASSSLPIVMADSTRHVTINPSQRQNHHHPHHHPHHHHNQHHHSSSRTPSQPNEMRRHPVTLHLNSTNGTYPSELASLLRHIVEHSGSRRADVLRDLRRLLKKSGGQLPDVDRMQFFEAFYPMLIDSKWKVVCECTMLIVDIIPQMGEHDLDPCMAIILPRVVPNLGHEATDVRRASLRLLHVYMRYTNNLQKVLRLYIQYGLESHDKSAQKGCVLSLPLLFTEEFSKENLFPLVQSLGHLLVHSDASLFYPIFLAMQRLHSLVGNETFRLYLQHLSQETVSLYQKVLSRASTADSGGRHEPDTIKNETINHIYNENNANGELIKKDISDSIQVNADQSNESFIQMEKLIATTPNDLPKCSFDESILDENETENEQENGNDHHEMECENRNDSRDRLMTGDSVISQVTSNSSESKMAFSNEYVLIYGIFPLAVHNRATSNKMTDKLEGLNQMIAIMKEAPDSHVAALIPYLPRFLDSFITIVVNNPNFKVTLIGLEMIELIVARLGVSAYPCLETVIDILLKRLGDGRSVVREHDIKVIHRLMLHWPPQNVLDMLLRHKFNRNPKVREEIINRVTFALLMFPRTEFNLHRITYEISTMLIDPKRQVRLSALESIAVIAQALGPSRLETLLSTVSSIEQTSESEGLLNAVQARLSRRDLPRCNPDGSLRYVLNVSNFSGWFPSTSEADIEWVLLASSTSPHIGTPPKLHHHYLGRFNEQYRRYTMKQAEAEGFHFKNPNLMTESEPESDKIVSKSAEPNKIFQDDENGHDAHNQSANCITSEDDKSEQSDESTKSRDLWRYYFMRFKQHLAVATCSSASSAISSRSKTADWTKKFYHDFDKSSRRTSYSQLTDYNSHQHQTHHSSYQNLVSHPHLINNQGMGHHHHHPNGDFGHGAGDEIESQMSQSYDESLHNETIGLIINHRDNRAFSMPSIATSGLIESHPESSHHNESHHYHHHPHHLDQPDNENFYPTNRKKSVQIASYPRSVPTSSEKRNSFQTESDLDITCERPRSASESSPPCTDQPEDDEMNCHETSKLNIPKSQGSRRGSISTQTDSKQNSQRSPNDQQSKDNQQSNKSNRRSSVLPSVSIDEPTESEDNQSEGNNKQTLAKQSLPTNEGKSEVNCNNNCGTKESDKLINQTKSDKQFDLNKNSEKIESGDGNKTESNDNCENLSTVSGSSKGDDDDNQDDIKHDNEDDNQEGDEGDQPDYQCIVEDEDAIIGNESATKDMKPKSQTPGLKRKSILVGGRKRLSRSSSPVHRQPQYHMIRIQPAIPPNANIRHIMENVVKTEGPFDNPHEALRAALAAFGEDAWTTKVEGMLAVTRLASFHPSILQKDFHSVIVSLVDEVKNLRSSVSRSAIFTLGDLFVKMKKSIESEIELIGSALLAKCSENASFIREDCEKALMSMVEEMPQIKSALVLVHWGANHRNMNVRRTAAFFLSILVEKMGPVKCLMGPKDIGEHLLQSSSKFLMDGSPHTRFHGRKIFSVLLNHNQFDKLLRKHVTPGTYRNICGILESIKRRGVGEKPADLTTPIKP